MWIIFLKFHQVLLQSTVVAEALAESKFPDIALSSEDAGTNETKEAARKVLEEKGQCAVSWIDAALSADLKLFSLWGKEESNTCIGKSPTKDTGDGGCCKNKMRLFNQTSTVQMVTTSSAPATRQLSYPVAPATSTNATELSLLSSSAQDNNVKKSTCGIKSWKSNFKAAVSQTPLKQSKSQTNLFGSKISNKIPASPGKKSSNVSDWKKDTGLQETAKLARQLQDEAENWFMKFVEKALDSGFRIAIKGASANSTKDRKTIWSDNKSKVTVVLACLKNVNDWLDQVTRQRKNLNPASVETISTLKQKLYEFLIQFCLHNPGSSDALWT